MGLDNWVPPAQSHTFRARKPAGLNSPKGRGEAPDGDVCMGAAGLYAKWLKKKRQDPIAEEDAEEDGQKTEGQAEEQGENA
jgi:hypothetical protein